MGNQAAVGEEPAQCRPGTAKAFDDLSEEVSHAEVPEPAIREGGYPSKAAAKWLVDNLRRELT